jgi:MFS family permease
MQRVLGYGAAAAGVAMLPAAVMIGFISAGLSARLIGRFGLRAMLAAGLAPIAVGFVFLLRLPVHGSYMTYLLPTMLLVGGFGLAFPAIITLAMSGASGSDAGVLSGLANTTQQVGAALGVAVLSTLAAARSAHLTAAGRTMPEALTGGYHVAFGVSAGLAAASLALAVAVFRSAPPARQQNRVRSHKIRRRPAPVRPDIANTCDSFPVSPTMMPTPSAESVISRAALRWRCDCALRR